MSEDTLIIIVFKYLCKAKKLNNISLINKEGPVEDEGPVRDEVLRSDDEHAAAVTHVRGGEEAG